MISRVVFVIGAIGFILSISVSGTRYQGPYGIWVMFLFMMLASGMYLFAGILRLHQRPKLEYGLWAVLGVLVVMGLINAQIHAHRLGGTVTQDYPTIDLQQGVRRTALVDQVMIVTLPPKVCYWQSEQADTIQFEEMNAGGTIVRITPLHGFSGLVSFYAVLPGETYGSVTCSTEPRR